MIKNILTSIVVLGLLSGCYQASQPSLIKKASVQNTKINSDIKFSFKIKDAASAGRIKSIDAYLINNFNYPLNSSSNAYGNNYKYQTDVVNGIINIVFINPPSGGPYYLALQAFDNTISGLPKNNITEKDDTILSVDKNVSRSTNNVSIINQQLVFSDSSAELNITINLAPYNELPVIITPQTGSNIPTSSIIAG